MFTVTVALLEILILRTPWRFSTGLDWSAPRPVDMHRVMTKTLGFYATLGIVGLVYWVVHQYHGAFFRNYWNAMEVFLPLFCIAQIPYFIFVDQRMRDPHDGYWQLGRWILGHKGDLTGQTVRQHFLGWAVKGFFLPIMFVDYINLLGSTPISFTNFISFYDLSLIHI